MLYLANEVQKGMLAGAGKIAEAQIELLSHPLNPMSYMGGAVMASALDVFAHSVEIKKKPRFGLDEAMIDGKAYPIEERIEARKPFGQLKHFIHAKSEGAPRLLIVAPMSGHFATLLRGTVERMVPNHDVWITDWRDARDVPMTAGGFDLEDYISYLIEWMEFIGPDKDDRGVHVLAVCQPSVPAYAAAAVMNREGHQLAPRTLTMMGGPIDTREAPTDVNDHATSKTQEWFIQNVIATVPRYYRGAGRRVYPGFLQLNSFMSMNLRSHMMSHWTMFNHLIEGDEDSAAKQKDFYDEYRAICDMTAEFYLQTVDVVFQRHLLPKGELNYRGTLVDPADIKDTALLAIEGELDDISGLGQTKAALEISTGLDEDKKNYFLASGVGHYGIFNGSKWRSKIAPVLEEWIEKHN